MLPTGHVAVSYILSRVAKADLKIAVIASLFPDLLDKSLKLVFHLVPGGRSLGHGLPAVVVISLVMTAWKGRRAGYSWGIAHLFHLFADYPFTEYVPWFYPLVPYSFPAGGPSILITLPEVLLDAGAVCLAVWVYFIKRGSTVKVSKEG